MSFLQRIHEAYLTERLSQTELSRYARQLLLPGIGTSGQLKLKAARVLVVGAGGLGCPVLQALAGAGVGRITVMDPDAVDHSNLARQWLHGIEDIGENKARSAAEALRRQNPCIKIDAAEVALAAGNAATFIGAHDIVIDATDDLGVRYTIDAVCAELDRPWVHAALYRERFQVAVFWARHAARFADLYPQRAEAPDCASAGVLGATAALAGNWQAWEAIKLITGGYTVDLGVIASVHAPGMEVSKFRLPAAKTLPPPGVAASPTGVGAWSPDRVRQACSIHEPVVWVDLRNRSGGAAGLLPGAVHIPPEAILEDSRCLPSGRTVCFICENGLVSGLLAAAINATGCDTLVAHLEGGMAAYCSQAIGEE